MATVFKTFLNNDLATTRTLLNEAIPIDGKIMFGSYQEPADPPNGSVSNVKAFPHEMFQSVYDYPFLLSSSNHIFDITLGASADSLLTFDATTGAGAKKRAIYNQFAQIMVGHDKDGNILKFDEDGNILEGGDKYDEAYLLSVARLLNKDEMKKGSFYLQLDFANTEPGQREYSLPDPYDPATSYPIDAAAATLVDFQTFSAASSCPAGFFQYNDEIRALARLVVTAGDFNDGDEIVIGSAPADQTYIFVTSLSGGPAAGTCEVVIGADAKETLQNFTNAINNGTGDGSLYEGVSPSSFFTATYSDDGGALPAQVEFAQKLIGAEGTPINLTLNSTGDVEGQLENIDDGTPNSDPFDATDDGGGSPTDGTALIGTALTGDIVVNSDDYRRISMIITDEGAQDDYRVNSPAGDYGILKIKEYKIEKWDAATNTISDVCVIDAEALQTAADDPDNSGDNGFYGIVGYDRKIGLVYYQAGVVAITPYAFVVFQSNSTAPDSAGPDWSSGLTARTGRIPAHTSTLVSSGSWWDGVGVQPDGPSPHPWTTCGNEQILAESLGEELPRSGFSIPNLISDGVTSLNVQEAWEQAPIDSSTGGDSNATGFRRRMVRMQFNNTTELNSSIYFCRLNNNEFNYSANPTYLNESKIRVKETTLDAPVSYITTVGLYSADNELLAQAKLSEPIRKDPTNEFVLRVRLDY